MTRFRFVSDYAEKYGVKRMCSTSKVSRSGFYDWKRRDESKHARRVAELGSLIAEIHQRSRTTYSAPRIHAELRRLDQRCAKKRMAPFMAAHGLVGAHARRKGRRGRPDVAPAPELVNREFTASRPSKIHRTKVPNAPGSRRSVRLGTLRMGLIGRVWDLWPYAPCPTVVNAERVGHLKETHRGAKGFIDTGVHRPPGKCSDRSSGTDPECTPRHLSGQLPAHRRFGRLRVHGWVQPVQSHRWCDRRVQADSYDEAERSGWTVMAVGHASHLRDSEALGRLELEGQLPEPWALGESAEQYFQIGLEQISGHWIA